MTRTSRRASPQPGSRSSARTENDAATRLSRRPRRPLARRRRPGRQHALRGRLHRAQARTESTRPRRSSPTRARAATSRRYRSSAAPSAQDSARPSTRSGFHEQTRRSLHHAYGSMTYLVLPKEISAFEASYLRRMNRIGLIFFALHVPVMVGLAWANGTGPWLALALSAAVVAGPALAYVTLPNPAARVRGLRRRGDVHGRACSCTSGRARCRSRCTSTSSRSSRCSRFSATRSSSSRRR